MPPCVNNNTIGIILDGTTVGNSARFLCDSGYAFPGDNVLKNLTCDKKEDEVNGVGVETAEWDWNTTEGECESTYRLICTQNKPKYEPIVVLLIQSCKTLCNDTTRKSNLHI